MTKYLLQITLQRTIEMLLGCVALSAAICALCVSGPMPEGSLQRDIALIAAPIVYIVWNIVMMRRCYAELVDDMNYYAVSLYAYIAFALINVSAYFFLPTDGYTWLFVVTKFLRYSNLGISTPVGITVFHGITVVSIFLAPSGMEWVHEKEERRKQYMDTLPPMLDVNPLEEKPKNTEEAHEEIQKKAQNNLSDM